MYYNHTQESSDTSVGIIWWHGRQDWWPVNGSSIALQTAQTSKEDETVTGRQSSGGNHEWQEIIIIADITGDSL